MPRADGPRALHNRYADSLHKKRTTKVVAMSISFPDQAQIDAHTSTKAPTYRDRELGALMKELRASVKGTRAELPLGRAEKRLRYVLSIVESWDKYHVNKAELLISLGMFDAANSEATLIFDANTREALYWRAPVSKDHGAAERLAEIAEMDREVLA
jgi:hypothetical protein